MALANEVVDRGSYRILDIGAGTGRNALALARLGHPVDVVEMTPAFAEAIRTEAQRESLNVRVIDHLHQDEFTDASSALPLELVSDVPVYDYEMANLPATAWPPTGWYEDWVSGLDVFDVPRERRPIELRWLVYRRG